MNLDAVYAALDEATRDVPIGAIGVVLAVVIIIALVLVLRRIPPLKVMADPAHNPALDRHEAALREVLTTEADDQERRSA